MFQEALKPTRRDRKEVEWLQHHIERVRQIGAQQIGECAAELNKHKDEVSYESRSACGGVLRTS